MRDDLPLRIASELKTEAPLTTEELLPRVYEQLRSIAGSRLSKLGPGQTLNATSLVHEAWLRLRSSDGASSWEHERHFFGAAARAMRFILVDRARAKSSERRGGAQLRVPFSDELLTNSTGPTVDVLALDHALEQLSKVYPLKAEIVSLRFFGGLTVAEVADLMQCSVSTVEKEWRFIRAWLRTEMFRTG